MHKDPTHNKLLVILRSLQFVFNLRKNFNSKGMCRQKQKVEWRFHRLSQEIHTAAVITDVTDWTEEEYNPFVYDWQTSKHIQDDFKIILALSSFVPFKSPALLQ